MLFVGSDRVVPETRSEVARVKVMLGLVLGGRAGWRWGRGGVFGLRRN